MCVGNRRLERDMIKISRGATCLPYALYIIPLSTLLFALRLISMDHLCGSTAYWFPVVFGQ